MMTFPTEWKVIKIMFQTTNQLGFMAIVIIDRIDKQTLLRGRNLVQMLFVYSRKKVLDIEYGWKWISTAGKQTRKILLMSPR